MPSKHRIMQLRIKKAKYKADRGKASKGELRLLERVAQWEREREERERHMEAFEYAISKEKE